MPFTLTWTDITIRLIFTVAAGFLIGLNRGERGKPAGLRTTMLVCLAASLSMILANSLMGTADFPPNSHVQLDMMRLPLGVLTGIGFIGAGTILKRGDMITGVTTAATVWFVTIIGLCYGAGQIKLGSIALGLAVIILWGLGWFDSQMLQERKATLTVVCDGKDGTGITEDELRDLLEKNSFLITACSVGYSEHGAENLMHLEIRWSAKRHEIQPPGFIKDLAARGGVKTVRWRA
jgi:putative Mg2+ transporter-C (MgtC) family protein